MSKLSIRRTTTLMFAAGDKIKPVCPKCGQRLSVCLAEQSFSDVPFEVWLCCGNCRAITKRDISGVYDENELTVDKIVEAASYFSDSKEPESKWISCVESMPTSEEKVLIAVPTHNKVYCAYYCKSCNLWKVPYGYKDTDQFPDLDQYWLTPEQVSHWMKIPKLPN